MDRNLAGLKGTVESRAAGQGGTWRLRPVQSEEQGKKNKFPAYDQMPQNGEKPADTMGTEAGQLALAKELQGSDFVKQMQKLLKASRKMDNRIRKAQTDRENMQAQWAEFQSQLRASFISQRQKYLQDTAKADDDLVEPRANKKDILEQIQAVVVEKAQREQDYGAGADDQARGRLERLGRGQRATASSPSCPGSACFPTINVGGGPSCGDRETGTNFASSQMQRRFLHLREEREHCLQLRLGE